MGVDLRRTSHVLWFVVVLPSLSLGVAWLSFHAIALVKGEFSFILDGLGVLGAYALLYGVFDRVAWRWRVFRWLKIVEHPDLSGRWAGTLQSSREGEGPLDAVAEIRQTFGSVDVHMYFQHSRSFSTMAQFVSAGNGARSLHYEYENVPNVDATETMYTHYGTAQLSCAAGVKRLEGQYYNRARDGRGYVGTIRLGWEGRGLVRQFESEPLRD